MVQAARERIDSSEMGALRVPVGVRVDVPRDGVLTPRVRCSCAPRVHAVVIVCTFAPASGAAAGDCGADHSADHSVVSRRHS